MQTCNETLTIPDMFQQSVSIYSGEQKLEQSHSKRILMEMFVVLMSNFLA